MICNTDLVKVRVPQHLSYTGQARWCEKAIDTCIADIVSTLNKARIFTDGSCCGHGVYDGNILLSDGRTLSVTFPEGHHKKENEEELQHA